MTPSRLFPRHPIKPPEAHRQRLPLFLDDARPAGYLLRVCSYKGDRALFHGWYEIATYQDGDIIRGVYALIEQEDGRMMYAAARDIRFTDSKRLLDHYDGKKDGEENDHPV